MTPQEARTLLDEIRMVDNKIGEPDDVRAVLWSQILAGMTLEKAIAGMKEHYRTSTETIMPAHIRAAADRVWRDWEGRQRSHLARQAPALECVAAMDEQSKAAARESREHSPAVAAELAELRAKLGPRKSGALDARWKVKYRGERQPAAGRDPERLGRLLRVVRDNVEGAA